MKQNLTSLTTLLVGIALSFGTALTSANAQSNQPPQAAPYRPGMGDFMTAAVQPRHIKLAASGQVNNWGYAAYALKELGESFDRITRTIPMYRSMPTSEFIAAFVKTPMADVDQAIKAGDPVRFKAAYNQLTQGCNACHVKTDRAMVVIQVPEAVTSYPDQNFQPPR